MKKPIIILLIILILMPIWELDEATAYWEPGGEDCMDEHGVGLILAEYVPDAEITLDGVSDEPAWAEAQEFVIPTASRNDTASFFISYIYLKMIYCDEYIYVSARWNDSTLLSPQDGISICWNINVEDFSAGMFLENPLIMKTHNPGEVVDNWLWSYSPGRENGSQYKMFDQSFDHNGWRDRSEEDQDIDSAFTYGELANGEEYYHVEMRRALITDDGEEYDVQFVENGDYYLTFAILDDTGGEDHAISYTWMASFSELETEHEDEQVIMGYPLFIFILAGIGAIVLKSRKTSGTLKSYVVGEN